MISRAHAITIFILLFGFVLACGPLSAIAPVPTNIPQPAFTFKPTSTPKPLPTITPERILIPTQLASSEGLDHINIYLVAMGDNGASGKYIGCGDSLVPVEIQIPVTMGVLRAAINELLKLQGQTKIGQSELYNALSLSKLTLEDVAVIDGEAIIEFSGTLIYGGECDIPRIEEQFYALALQFSTVDRVVVTVNGVPLQTLLDLRG